MNSGPVNDAASRSTTRSIRCGVVGGQRRRLGPHLVGPPRGQVLDGGRDEPGLRRIVVQLSAPRDAGHLGDDRRRGAGPAVFDQRVDGRVEQPLLRDAAALLLRSVRQRGCGHQFPACRRANKQSRLHVLSMRCDRNSRSAAQSGLRITFVGTTGRHCSPMIETKLRRVLGAPVAPGRARSRSCRRAAASRARRSRRAPC